VLKIIFTLLFLGVYCHASPLWLSETDFGLVKAETSNGTTGYKHQIDCESVSGESCFDPDDARHWKIEFGLMVPDVAGQATADTKDAQRLTDAGLRKTAKGTRETSLQQCVQDSKNPTLSPQQIKDCLGALVRQILGNKVAVPDL